MHVQTHILSGWCIGNLFPLTARERLLCMIAASAPDVDGLSRLGGEECYWRWHHTLGHNLPLGVVVSVFFAAISTRKVPTFFLYLALFHLHLVMDFFGSGPGWHIHYLWPLQFIWPRAQWIWINPNAWDFYSWQNIAVALGFVAWTIVIAAVQRRTPLETLTPSLDRSFVHWIRHEPPEARAPA